MRREECIEFDNLDVTHIFNQMKPVLSTEGRTMKHTVCREKNKDSESEKGQKNIKRK